MKSKFYSEKNSNNEYNRAGEVRSARKYIVQDNK